MLSCIPHGQEPLSPAEGAAHTARRRRRSLSIPSEPHGQGWLQLAELGFAFLLSALIGLERELRKKSAGLRTYTLVGLSSALFLLVSKYGFDDVLHAGTVVVDPSRVAAQIVSGIGFLGAGIIFVKGDVVRGLTTASTVWLTAAVGMACGAGLPLLALAATAAHFATILLFPHLLKRIPAAFPPREKREPFPEEE